MKERTLGWRGLAWGLGPVLLLAASCGNSLSLGEDAAKAGQAGSSGAGTGCPGKSAACAGAGGATTARSSTTGGDELGGAGDVVGGGGKSSGGGDAPGGTSSIDEGGMAGRAAGGAGGTGNLVRVDCNGDAFELDAARTKLCVMLASCAGPNFSATADNRGADLSTGFCVADGPVVTAFDFYFNRQVERPLQFDARASACLISVETCDDVLACAGYRKPLDECAGDAGTRCEGERAINCGDAAVVTDCARTTGQQGTCKVATLSGGAKRAVCDTGIACSSDELAPTCQGDTLFSCEGGLSNATHCPEFGLICHEFAGYAACVERPPTATCTDFDTPGCDGTKRRYCNPDGVLYEHECTSVAGLTCYESTGDQPTDRSFLQCAPRGCEDIEGIVNPDECQGDDLRLGIPGDIVLHCPDFGFATCRDGVCAD